MFTIEVELPGVIIYKKYKTIDHLGVKTIKLVSTEVVDTIPF